jgi:acyl-CoA thioesterase
MDEATRFSRALSVQPRADRPGAYDAELDPDFRVGGAEHGGLLLALAGQALRAHLPHPDPLSISAYYLTAARPGPAVLHADVLRRSRSLSTGSVRLSQPGEDGRPVDRLHALATFGDLAALPDEVRTSATPPDLPPPEECVSPALAPPELAALTSLHRRLDLRLDPATVGWAVGQPSGAGRIQGWLRFPGEDPDVLSLLLAADALPPTAFDLGVRAGWAPTLELTAHVRARPAPGWLLVSQHTRNLAHGLFEEDCEVWDSAGRLVVQARQLARLPSGASR